LRNFSGLPKSPNSRENIILRQSTRVSNSEPHRGGAEESLKIKPGALSIVLCLKILLACTNFAEHKKPDSAALHPGYEPIGALSAPYGNYEWKRPHLHPGARDEGGGTSKQLGGTP
jgi:hypothetical protein